MARPRKPIDQKLVVLTVCVPPAFYDEIGKLSDRQESSLSAFAARLLVIGLRNWKTSTSSKSP